MEFILPTSGHRFLMSCSFRPEYYTELVVTHLYTQKILQGKVNSVKFTKSLNYYYFFLGETGSDMSHVPTRKK